MVGIVRGLLLTRFDGSSVDEVVGAAVDTLTPLADVEEEAATAAAAILFSDVIVVADVLGGVEGVLHLELTVIDVVAVGAAVAVVVTDADIDAPTVSISRLEEEGSGGDGDVVARLSHMDAMPLPFPVGMPGPAGWIIASGVVRSEIVPISDTSLLVSSALLSLVGDCCCEFNCC